MPPPFARRQTMPPDALTSAASGSIPAAPQPTDFVFGHRHPAKVTAPSSLLVGSAVVTLLPTVCVIGAGSSGIAAAKALAAHGFEFDCFDASDRVGGNWVWGNTNGMASAYRSLHINPSRVKMEYTDFPMPESYPDFPHHTHIAAYFDAYVDHFGFRDRITFETRVARAERRAGGGWDVTTDRYGTRSYDALIVANGHHWDAR